MLDAVKLVGQVTGVIIRPVTNHMTELLITKACFSDKHMITSQGNKVNTKKQESKILLLTFPNLNLPS